jgi:anti-anti-sigma factor
MASEVQPIRMQVLRLRGELNVEDVRNLGTLLSEYLKGGLIHVVLNLENVSHVSLEAIPLLAVKTRGFRECGGDLKLVGLSAYLQHMWDLAGYSHQFNFCRSEEEAGWNFSAAGAAA